MWGRKRERAAEQEKDVAAARAAQQHAEEVIAIVDAQQAEVAQIVHRLERRELKNNFGDALVIAMEKRQA